MTQRSHRVSAMFDATDPTIAGLTWHITYTALYVGAGSWRLSARAHPQYAELELMYWDSGSGDAGTACIPVLLGGSQVEPADVPEGLVRAALEAFIMTDRFPAMRSAVADALLGPKGYKAHNGYVRDALEFGGLREAFQHGAKDAPTLE